MRVSRRRGFEVSILYFVHAVQIGRLNFTTCIFELLARDAGILKLDVGLKYEILSIRRVRIRELIEDRLPMKEIETKIRIPNI